jgi:hypothetical protein
MEVSNGYRVNHFPAELGKRCFICVVVGRSYKVDSVEGKSVPDEEPAELALIDEQVEGQDPFAASLLRPSDMEPMKRRQDVLMVGTARAPGGEPALTWDVKLQVGEWVKAVKIVGPRRYHHVEASKKGKKRLPRPPVFDEPSAVAEVPLRYEYAFGGKGRYVPDDPEAYARAVERAEKLTNAVAPPPPEKEDGGDASPPDGGEAGSPGEAIPDDGDAKETAGAAATPKAPAGPGGTKILSVADAGEEQVVDEGWDKDLARKDEPKPAPPEEDDSPFPLIPCPTNPVGRGFAVSNREETLEGMLLPQIEDPQRAIEPADLPIDLSQPSSAPIPAGFGPISRCWAPRSARMGLDEEGQKEARDRIDEMLLDLDPEDPDQQLAILALSDAELPAHNDLVFNAAPDDQQLTGLRGDERVRVEGVKTEGPVDFRLPGDRPLAVVHRGEGPEPVIVRLDTIWIDADKEEIRLTWRGRLGVPSMDAVAEYPELRVEILDGAEAAGIGAEAKEKSEGGTLVLDGSEVAALEDDEALKDPTGDAGELGEDVYVEGLEYEASPFGPDLSDGSGEEPDPEELLKQQRAERRKKVAELKAKVLAAREAAEKKKKKSKKKS